MNRYEVAFFIVSTFATSDMDDEHFHRIVKELFVPCLEKVLEISKFNFDHEALVS